MNLNKINRLVAEKVMGLVVTTNAGCDEPHMWIDIDGSVWYAGGIAQWNPCENLNQAMEAEEMMFAKGYRMYLERTRDGFSAAFYIGHWGDPAHIRGHARDINPATAICLAALGVLGVTEEEIN